VNYSSIGWFKEDKLHGYAHVDYSGVISKGLFEDGKYKRNVDAIKKYDITNDRIAKKDDMNNYLVPYNSQSLFDV